MEEVKRIDEIKDRVESAHTLLSEAARFEALVRTLDQQDSGESVNGVDNVEGLQRIVETIQEMQESLNHLPPSLPRVERGKKTVERMVGKLEESLAPQFRQSVTNCDRGNDDLHSAPLLTLQREPCSS